MVNKPKILPHESICDVSEYRRRYGITMDDYNKWLENFDFINIEKGYIDGEAHIVKYYPAREEEI